MLELYVCLKKANWFDITGDRRLEGLGEACSSLPTLEQWGHLPLSPVILWADSMFPQVALSGEGRAGKSNGLQSYVRKCCSGSMFLQISVLLRVISAIRKTSYKELYWTFSTSERPVAAAHELVSTQVEIIFPHSQGCPASPESTHGRQQGQVCSSPDLSPASHPSR